MMIGESGVDGSMNVRKEGSCRLEPVSFLVKAWSRWEFKKGVGCTAESLPPPKTDAQQEVRLPRST